MICSILFNECTVVVMLFAIIKIIEQRNIGKKSSGVVKVHKNKKLEYM